MDKAQQRPQYPVGGAEHPTDDGSGCCNVTVYRRCDGCPHDRPQPPSASGELRTEQLENAAFTAWWCANQECPEHSLMTQNAAHAAWQARAALAPSPGIDAAEQTRAMLRETQTLLIAMRHEIEAQIRTNLAVLDSAPPAAQPSAEQPPLAWLQQNIDRPTWFEIAGANDKAVTKDWTDAFPVFRQPVAAQPDAEWMAEAERLVNDYATSINKAYSRRYEARAALLAHLRGPHAAT